MIKQESETIAEKEKRFLTILPEEKRFIESTESLLFSNVGRSRFGNLTDKQKEYLLNTVESLHSRSFYSSSEFNATELSKKLDFGNYFLNSRELTSIVHKIDTVNYKIQYLLSEVQFFTKERSNSENSSLQSLTFPVDKNGVWDDISFLIELVYDPRSGYLRMIQNYFLSVEENKELAPLTDRITIPLEEKMEIKRVLVRNYLTNLDRLILFFRNANREILYDTNRELQFSSEEKNAVGESTSCSVEESEIMSVASLSTKNIELLNSEVFSDKQITPFSFITSDYINDHGIVTNAFKNAAISSFGLGTGGFFATFLPFVYPGALMGGIRWNWNSLAISHLVYGCRSHEKRIITMKIIEKIMLSIQIQRDELSSYYNENLIKSGLQNVDNFHSQSMSADKQQGKSESPNLFIKGEKEEAQQVQQTPRPASTNGSVSREVGHPGQKEKDDCSVSFPLLSSSLSLFKSGGAHDPRAQQLCMTSVSDSENEFANPLPSGKVESQMISKKDYDELLALNTSANGHIESLFETYKSQKEETKQLKDQLKDESTKSKKLAEQIKNMRGDKWWIGNTLNLVTSKQNSFSTTLLSLVCFAFFGIFFLTGLVSWLRWALNKLLSWKVKGNKQKPGNLKRI